MLENISEENKINNNVDDSHVHLSLLERQTGDRWHLWSELTGVAKSGLREANAVVNMIVDGPNKKQDFITNTVLKRPNMISRGIWE